MYNQQSFQSSFLPQSTSSGWASSQYRGLETKYQPVGYVQSQYNPSANQSAMQQPFSSSSAQYQNFQNQNPQSYHTANYQGNQQGHDNYWRADSTQPSSQSQFRAGVSTSSYGITQQPSQFQSAQSFHTANYRGDQPGHDSYWRGDSVQPAQQQFGMGAVSGIGSQYSLSSISSGLNQQTSSLGQSTQSQNPQSFHTANYRGNQPGHDSSWRADATQPSQSQFGMGASSLGFNRSQF